MKDYVFVAIVLIGLSLAFSYFHFQKDIEKIYAPPYDQAVTHLKQAAESRGMRWDLSDDGSETLNFCATAVEPNGTDYINCENNPAIAAENTAKDIENGKVFSKPRKTLAEGSASENPIKH